MKICCLFCSVDMQTKKACKVSVMPDILHAFFRKLAESLPLTSTCMVLCIFMRLKFNKLKSDLRHLYNHLTKNLAQMTSIQQKNKPTRFLTQNALGKSNRP